MGCNGMLFVRVLFLCFAGLVAVTTSAKAGAIGVELSYDLNDSIDVGAFWKTPILSFPEIYPEKGDTVLIAISFVDKNSLIQQRLQIHDFGVGIPEEIFLAQLHGNEGISINFIIGSEVVLSNVMGDAAVDSFSRGFIGSGGGVATNFDGDWTTSDFSFTGFVWEIRFSDLIYHSGSGFHRVEFSMRVDGHSVIQSVPEPTPISILGAFLTTLFVIRQIPNIAKIIAPKRMGYA